MMLSNNLPKLKKKIFTYNKFLFSKILSKIRSAQNLNNTSSDTLNFYNQEVLEQSTFWIKSLTWALISATSFGIGWLAFAKTEEVIVAKGKLEPFGEVKKIQLPPSSVVKRILVKNGDLVEKGDILIELDQKALNEKLAFLIKSLLEIENQMTEIDNLSSEKIKSLTDNLKLNEDILQKLNPLFKEGAISEIQYLIQKNKVSNIETSILKEKIESSLKESQLNSKIADIEYQIIDSKVGLQYKSILSPVKGSIFDLKVTTPGYFNQIREPVMKIVPFEKLEADIEIPSRKIGFVKVGQQADISIDSFPSNDFGVLKGEVKSVGSDALSPNAEKQRSDYQYPATIKLKNQFLNLKNGTKLPLQTGMSLTANIKLRKVSYLQLLLSSFKSKVSSLSEI